MQNYSWLLRAKGLNVRGMSMWLKGHGRSPCWCECSGLTAWMQHNPTMRLHCTIVSLGPWGKVGKGIQYLCTIPSSYIWIGMCLTVKMLLQNSRLPIPDFPPLWNKVQYLSQIIGSSFVLSVCIAPSTDSKLLCHGNRILNECLHLFVSSLASLSVPWHTLRATSTSAPSPVRQMDLWMFILERQSLKNSLMQTNKPYVAGKIGLGCFVTF